MGRSFDASLTEALAHAVDSAKERIHDIASSLDDKHRQALIAQISRLHRAEEWEEGDKPLRPASLENFLRVMLRLKPKKWPSLGMTYDGYLLANWGSRLDQLNMWFAADDDVHWSLYRERPGARAELAAGIGVAEDLPRMLAPYDLGHWLDANYDGTLLAAGNP
jgi:hypothetical protein